MKKLYKKLHELDLFQAEFRQLFEQQAVDYLRRTPRLLKRVVELSDTGWCCSARTDFSSLRCVESCFVSIGRNITNFEQVQGKCPLVFSGVMQELEESFNYYYRRR